VTKEREMQEEKHWKHLCFFCKEAVAFETDSSTAKIAERSGTLAL